MLAVPAAVQQLRRRLGPGAGGDEVFGVVAVVARLLRALGADAVVVRRVRRFEVDRATFRLLVAPVQRVGAERQRHVAEPVVRRSHGAVEADGDARGPDVGYLRRNPLVD